MKQKPKPIYKEVICMYEDTVNESITETLGVIFGIPPLWAVLVFLTPFAWVHKLIRWVKK
jgi:hypothetical protein